MNKRASVENLFNKTIDWLEALKEDALNLLEEESGENVVNQTPQYRMEGEFLDELNEYPLMMDVQDIKEIFRIGERQAYRLAKRDDFPSFRLGNSIRISRHGLKLWNSVRNHGEQSG